jgi:hypothetical protein
MAVRAHGVILQTADTFERTAVMGMEIEYKSVQAEITDAEENLEPVHLDVNGMHLDLPNLNSTNLPIELVQAVLLVKSKVVLTDEELAQTTSIFLAYFQTMKPNFWNKLRKTDHPMNWLMGTVKFWAVESGIDPKALS